MTFYPSAWCHSQGTRSEIFATKENKMPVPNDIQNNPLAYAQVWTGNRNVTGRGTPQAPGVVKARRFVTYIEVLEQGAHDPEIRTLAIQRGMTPRPMHRGRVSPLNTTATQLTYYAPHGQEAAD